MQRSHYLLLGVLALLPTLLAPSAPAQPAQAARVPSLPETQPAPIGTYSASAGPQLSQLKPIPAQDAGPPLIASQVLSASTDVFLVWSQTPEGTGGSDPADIFQKVYRESDPPSSPPTGQPPRTLAAVAGQRNQETAVANNRRHIDAVSGDFDGDGADDFVSAWESAAGSVRMLLKPGSANSFAGASRITVNGPLATAGGDVQSRIRLATGRLAGSKDQVVLAYQASNNTIRIDVYGTDAGGALVSTPIATIADEALAPGLGNLAQYAVAAGDFDNDGFDEIALAATEAASPSVNVYVKLYKLAGNTLQPKARRAVLLSTDIDDFNVALLNLGVASGNFDSTAGDEIALGVAYFQTLGSGDDDIDDTVLYLLRAADDSGTPAVDPLETISFGPANRAGANLMSINNIEPLSLVAGDLNGDLRAEAALLVGGNLRVYASDDGLVPTFKASVGVGGSNAETDDRVYRNLAIGGGGISSASLVVATDGYRLDSVNVIQTFDLTVYAMLPDLSGLTVSSRLSGDEEITTGQNVGEGRRYAMAAGSGNSLRLGTPQTYQTARIQQPLVILKAPPIHFDVVGGQTYDLSKCFGDAVCAFRATYGSTVAGQVEATTELRSDWSISSQLEAEGGAFGVTVKASLEAKYGRGFVNTNTGVQSFSLTQEANAIVEDRIYALLVIYTIWEYPVFANNTLVGHVLVAKPGPSQPTWFGSKGWNAYSYVPDNEVGNLLSYPEYQSDGQNSYRQRPAIPIQQLNSITLDGFTSNDGWRFTSSSITSTSAQTSTNIGLGVGASIGAGRDFGLFSASATLSVQGNYNSQSMENVKTTVSSGFEVRGNYGQLVRDPEVRYTITPYAYWANNGALVLDYSVQLEQGVIETWWQQVYGKQPDPAFNLPFRLDPAKGIGINPEKQFLTKDIVFDPPTATAGQEVTITARVRNYSLLPSPGPTLHFFVGDPGAGGTPLGSATAVTTTIAPRGSAYVQLRVTLPAQLTNFPRIYALLDQGNTIAEVHEDNNKAFAILGAIGNSGPPLASFGTIAASNQLQLTFENTSNGEFTSVLWDFGDGNTSTLASPTHTYARPGTYTVRLTLGGPEGSDVLTQTVTVGANGGERYLPLLLR